MIEPVQKSNHTKAKKQSKIFGKAIKHDKYLLLYIFRRIQAGMTRENVGKWRI